MGTLTRIKEKASPSPVRQVKKVTSKNYSSSGYTRKIDMNYNTLGKNGEHEDSEEIVRDSLAKYIKFD
jgi:hypothetical protein